MVLFNAQVASWWCKFTDPHSKQWCDNVCTIDPRIYHNLAIYGAFMSRKGKNQFWNTEKRPFLKLSEIYY